MCLTDDDDHDSLDPIIGQGDRVTAGLDPTKESGEHSIPSFVIPKGGEYFFVPGLSGLKNTIAEHSY